MSDEELDKIAQAIPFIKAWVAAVESELTERIEAGAGFDHVALVPKRATRKWVDGTDVIAVLRQFGTLDTIAPRVPLTPAKAQEILGRTKYGLLSEYVTKESSGMNLVYG